MRRFFCLIAVWACWVLSVLPGHGQAMPGWLAKNGTPKAPEFGIMDQNGFFSRDSGAFKRIADQLRKLEEEHGYKIILMVEPVTIGTSAPQLAAELREAWLPKGDGLVVVFESDSRNLGIGRELNVYPQSQNSAPLIPANETAALITRAIEGVDPKLGPEAFIEALAGNLVAECDGYFSRRTAPVTPGRSLRISLLVVGVLALLALAAIGMGWLVRNSGMAEVPTFRFPPTDRPERLGAPCGCNVTARRFAKPTSR